uniref:SUMO-activating enzyme subunit 1 n=1 Tax=Pelodiscus sinensis TaxID=13735 RepID=K7GER2_PELSI
VSTLRRSRMRRSGSLGEIDEGLCSWQLYVLGPAAMRRLADTTVLVSGMKGLAVEIAKNIILAGVKSVTVHDPGKAQWSDLSSQFFLSESDIGRNRALASQRHLAELNSYVPVTTATGELAESFLAAFQVVVLTNSPLEEQLRVSDICHAHNIRFVLADTKGLAGELLFPQGRPGVVTCGEVIGIIKGRPGVVTCGDGQGHGHGFADGDFVTFSGVEGMSQLNGCEPRALRVLDEPLALSTCSSYGLPALGWAVAVPPPTVLCPQEPLRAALVEPKLKGMDDRGHSLHLAFQALHAFAAETGRLPRPRAQVRALPGAVLATRPNRQRPPSLLVPNLPLPPMALPDLCPSPPPQPRLAVGPLARGCGVPPRGLHWVRPWPAACRPGKQHVLSSNQWKTEGRPGKVEGTCRLLRGTSRPALGARALLSCPASSRVTVPRPGWPHSSLGCSPTPLLACSQPSSLAACPVNHADLEHWPLPIGPWDGQKLKSETAAAGRAGPPPRAPAPAHSPSRPSGWEGATPALVSAQPHRALCLAVPLVPTGAYVDSRCIRYLKPLLDSGTEGTKGHVQVVVPHLTQPFGSPLDSAETAVPLCTLRHFPSTIEHTLQVGLLEGVRSSLQETPRSWQDCVRWARWRWESLYHQAVLQLLHAFPPGHEISPGIPFWAPPKRCPQPLEFDYDNSTHMGYIMAAASLFAQMHRLQVPRDRVVARETLQAMAVPPFRPKEGVRIPVTEEELAQAPAGGVRQELLGGRRSGPCLMEPIHFEKDDEGNGHVDFIMAASKLRAENYGIAPADWHK